jgi:hypothetical protein
VADIKDVLTGQLAISEQIPTEADLTDDPLVVDLDDHQYNGQIGFLPRHYLRYPMVGSAVPHMADVEKIARFASGVIVQGRGSSSSRCTRSPVPCARQGPCT